MASTDVQVAAAAMLHTGAIAGVGKSGRKHQLEKVVFNFSHLGRTATPDVVMPQSERKGKPFHWLLGTLVGLPCSGEPTSDAKKCVILNVCVSAFVYFFKCGGARCAMERLTRNATDTEWWLHTLILRVFVLGSKRTAATCVSHRRS